MHRVSFVFLLAAVFPVQAEGDEGRTAGGGLVVDDLCGQTQSACVQLAQSLVGPNIEVFNVQCYAACRAVGSFSGGAAAIGFDSGIVLSTGSVAEIVGPNDLPNETSRNGRPGDSQLAAMVPGKTLCAVPGLPLRRTCDAAILEFDFLYAPGCQGASVLSFEYVFASEEYSEFVLPTPFSFNDVFAFFLNGDNIAIVPGTTSTAVAVENLHCGVFRTDCCDVSHLRDCAPYGGPNCILFRNNSFGHPGLTHCPEPGCQDDINGSCPDTMPVETEMDGLTIPLVATGPVNPIGVNHIKLAIADVGDPKLDSNVFLKAGSFQCIEPTGACCDRATLTCLDKVQKGDCGGEWLPGLTCDRFNPPCRKHRMLVLLDRTGSMNNIRPRTLNTRCFDALDTAKQDVADFFINNPIGEVAVWTFAGTAYTDRIGGFVDRDTALAALNDPAVATCGSLTPLAEAMCAAVDALAAGIPNPFPDELILAVSSDGQENYSDGECFGSDAFAGTECGTYDAGSWQQLVCEKVIGHAVVMVRFWGALEFASASSVDEETGQVAGASVSDFMYFQNLAESSGGRFEFMDDVAGPPTGACCDDIDRCRGGVTSDACAVIGGVYLGDATDCSTVFCSSRATEVPTLSEWGVVAMTLLLLLSGTLILARQHTLPM